MIKTRADLKLYLEKDAIACKRKSVRPDFLGEIWKFQVLLRKMEYYSNCSTFERKFYFIDRLFTKLRFHNLSIRLGFSIPINVFDKGLAIMHYGSIVVNNNAKIGENCKIFDGVNIVADGGDSRAPQIGKNVFIGTGAKIIGSIVIADDIAIGANAVVVKDITEKGTIWGGVPAHKISNNDSKLNLTRELFDN